MKRALLVVLLSLLICACSKNNTKKVEQMVLDSAQNTPMPVYGSGGGITGNYKPTKCQLVHKEGNVYVGQLCNDSGMCLQIEAISDGDSATWKQVQ